MKTLRAATIISLIIGVVVLFYSTSPLQADNEILIGTESGPERLWFPESYFISRGNHPVFTRSDIMYFYPTLRRGGFDYVRSSRQKRLRYNGGDQEDESFKFILQACSLKVLINANYDDGDFNCWRAWKSDCWDTFSITDNRKTKFTESD